jgi:2-oxoglutarate ferredoxin oxidoreductase subunit beta
MLANMEPPAFPAPIGVIRAVQEPTLETAIHQQLADVTAKKGDGDLKKLIYSGEIWQVQG